MSTTEITTSLDQNALAALPESLQQRILAASEQLKESSAVSVNKIRNDAKSYILPDGEEVDSFTGIIVAAKHGNIHYAGEYEEGVSNPPDCIAVIEGQNDAKCTSLKPHSMVEKPHHTNCADCPKFQWGSDKGGKGKGKECSEYVMLAVYVPSLGEELFLVEEKKGNAKVADGYLRSVTDKYGHPIAVTTRFIMGKKAKWAQQLESVSATQQDLLVNLADRMEEATNMLVERITGPYLAAHSGDSGDSLVTTTGEENPGRKSRSR